jgi:hypothetical protein
MFAALRKWLAILVILYPLGGLASCSTFALVDKLTEPRNLLAKVHTGMTPKDVEAIIGRPPEFKINYACVPDCGPFSHNWTIYGHRVEVLFGQSGRVEEVIAWQREPGPIGRFIGWVFFWWVPNLD